MSKGKSLAAEAPKVEGFYRLNIVENINGVPTVVGDTGWRKNQITNAGFQNGIVSCLGGISGSSQITHAALGTGTAPGASDTSLNGEITDVAGARMAVTPTVVSTKTLQFAFTLNSGVYTAAKTIQNVGLFQTSTTNAGSLYAGNTYSTSQLQTNQSVNGTYQLRFS
jgi:hypothetical protein